MEVLYQLSYVGASPNPIAVAADRDIIGTPNDQKYPAVSGAFSWGVLGRYRGRVVDQARPAQSPRDLKPQQRRDSTDKETAYAYPW
jgi:hypothetical protein